MLHGFKLKCRSTCHNHGADKVAAAKVTTTQLMLLKAVATFVQSGIQDGIQNIK